MHPGKETLNDYVDGVLEPDGRAEVEQHLHECSDCALAVAALQHIIHEAASLSMLAPPSHAWTELQARLATPAAESGRRAEPPSLVKRFTTSFGVPRRNAKREG